MQVFHWVQNTSCLIVAALKNTIVNVRPICVNMTTSLWNSILLEPSEFSVMPVFPGRKMVSE